MQLVVPATFTGTGAKIALADIPGAPKKCKWFQVTGATVTAGSNLGDANVSSTQGYPIGTSTGQFNPPIALAMEFYDLTQIYLWGGLGDTVILVCAI